MLARYDYNYILKITIFLAILFHVSGLLGMLSSFREWFVSMTSFTLYLMSILLYFNELKKDSAFHAYLLFSFTAGFMAEVIGVNFGYLFGDYSYSDRLGLSLMGVPLVIGVQWFVTTYAMANLVNLISKYLYRLNNKLNITIWQKIFFAAVLTTGFDIILEPAAIKLGYWQWYPDGSVPLYNYVCWFGVSLLLHTFLFSHPELKSRENVFAVALSAIQMVFFLILGWAR